MHPLHNDLKADHQDLLRFETLLTNLSARFVSVTSASMDEETVNAQQQIVKTLGAGSGVLENKGWKPGWK